MDLFHQYFENSARRFCDRIALSIGEEHATYTQVNYLASFIANILIDRGLERGERVAMYASISIEAVASAIAIFKAGAVLVPIRHTVDAAELIAELIDCGARALITNDPRVIDLDFSSTELKTVVPIDGTPSFSVDRRITDFRLQKKQSEIVSRMLDPDLDRPAAIFYTSGSTDRPKGVLVSHRNMVSAFLSVSGYLENTSDDVILSYSPGLSSDYAFYNIFMPLLFGGRAVVEPSLPLEPCAMVELINREKVTGLQVFPPALFHLARIKNVQRQKIPSLRYISSSGQSLGPVLIPLLRAAFPQVKIFSNYGATECKRMTCLPPEEIEKRPLSVGKAIPGIRTYLVDEAGELIDRPDAIGELAVAGDLVMLRYWNLPEATALRLKKNVFGEETVFFTGDLFKTDADGFLYFVARKGDLFHRNYRTVNPKEIEQLILSHDAVSEAVVVPVPDAVAGHVPRACVVLRNGACLDAESLIQYCAKHLDWHLVPTGVSFLKSLPRTFGGKTSIAGLVAGDL